MQPSINSPTSQPSAPALTEMWQFPATYRLVSLLCRPLRIGSPTSTQLEAALQHPQQHTQLVADLHARLLGISTGATATKKWLQSTSRFVRNRPDDFPSSKFCTVRQPHSTSDANGKADTAIPHADRHEISDPDGHHSVGHDDEDEVFVFPIELEAYTNALTPAVRLMVLHTIAEIVLAEHDQRLTCGSLVDIPIQELRVEPLGTDATGNIYWYFGDGERIYREPREMPRQYPIAKPVQPRERNHVASQGQNSHEDRLQKPACSDSKTQPCVAEPTHSQVPEASTDPKRKALNDTTSQLVEDIFGPNDSSQDSVEVLTSVATPQKKRTAAECGVVIHAATTSHDGKKVNGKIAHSESTEIEKRSLSLKEKGASSSQRRSSSQSAGTHGTSLPKERRMSGRRRRPPERHGSEVHSKPTRPAKRPRRSDPTFVDSELRKCDSWQTLSIGSEALNALLDRFRSEKGGVLVLERSLFHSMKEVVLPMILENELKQRREIERKQKAEMLAASQKRSTRLEAITIRRAEESRRAAEEEDRKREEHKLLALHERTVQILLANAEKEQSRDIRNARRMRGMHDSIVRDDKLHKLNEQSVNGSSKGSVAVRRSSRALRGKRRLGSDLSTGESFTGIDKTNDVMGHDSVAPGAFAMDLDVKVETSIIADKAKEEAEEEKMPEKDSEVKDEVSRSCITAAHPEEDISESFSWDTNATDKLPKRVLDKFFFASRATFSEAGLEKCSEGMDDMVGLGILIPPTKSEASVLRVELAQVTEWIIEYGRDPKQWVKTAHGWYELRTPATEYRNEFANARRKFEICGRIGILGETMRAAQLQYGTVMDLLQLRYGEMMAYEEGEVLNEKRFIIKQLKLLDRKSLNQCGFLKTLKSKVRTEDRKVAAESTKKATRASKKNVGSGNEAGGSQGNGESDVPEGNASKEGQSGGGVANKAIGKQSTRKRNLTNGRRQVPRAVSSIISYLLKSATKSHKGTPRKKKRAAKSEDVIPEDEVSGGAMKKEGNGVEAEAGPSMPLKKKIRMDDRDRK